MAEEDKPGDTPRKPTAPGSPEGRVVQSLLDEMVDGREYQSIVDAVPAPTLNVVVETQRALRDIESARGRPCLAYVGNVITPGPGSEIGPLDDLPFAELVASIPVSERQIDIFLATIGGSGQQVGRFVDALRPRFDRVEFLVPSFCMSAGTMFALSGDNILMGPRACLGPIDPQVRTVEPGRYLPTSSKSHPCKNLLSDLTIHLSD